MSVKVGSARYDENGKGTGGTAGDQTGKEVSTQNWYSKPWDFMALYPNISVMDAQAKAMQDACDNDNIGYDKNERNTLNTQAAKVSYDLSKIKTACEADCSSLNNVCAISGGAVSDDSYGTNGWTTSNMRQKMKDAGYVIITDKAYLTSEKYAVKGATYVTEGSHTVMSLDNGSAYTDTLKKAGITGGKSNEEIAQEVIEGKWGNNPERKTALTNAGYDYEAIQAIVNSMLKGTSSNSATKTDTSKVSGIPSYKVNGTYTLQSNMNVRKAPSKKADLVGYAGLTADGKKHDSDKNGSLDKGTKVTNKGVTECDSDGYAWMKIPSGYIAAYYVSGSKVTVYVK